MSDLIPFNKPYLSGQEISFIKEAIETGKISGDGNFTKKCHSFFEEKFSFKKVLLTTSCTDALEMAAILLDVKDGDEVIVPSYTFVSTANAFVLRGAKIIFADSLSHHPNIDIESIKKLITSKTKVIVPVHYAGMACNMDEIMEVANQHNIFVVEDAAQAINSYYNNKPLGSFGHLAAFSFHETKNIVCGEGGMLVINDTRFIERAEIIREKGTNRNKFLKGEVDKYEWVDVGSSFLPSDITAAFLYAQCLQIETIQAKRLEIWNLYYNNLKDLQDKELVQLPKLPPYSSNNAHVFYLVCKNFQERTSLINELKKRDISSSFHYVSLHNSRFFKNKHDRRELPNADKYTNFLLRLPLYVDLDKESVNRICHIITDFYNHI